MGQALEAEVRARFAEEQGRPDVRAAAVDAARDAFLASPKADRIRDKVRGENESQWIADGEAAARELIEQEEAAKHEAFMAERRTRFMESSSAEAIRRRAKEKFEKDWGKASDEQLAEELGDSELQRLLTEKAELATKELARANRSAVLEAEFNGRGIDVEALEPGDLLAIYLGVITTRTGTETYYDQNYGNRTREKNETGVEYSRKIVFEVLGPDEDNPDIQKGTCVVRSDSIAESDSDYEKSLALKRGTEVLVGRCITRGGKPRLDTRVAVGMLFVYDTDTETPDEFVEIPVPIVNVEINGIPARKVDYMVPKGAKPKSK